MYVQFSFEVISLQPIIYYVHSSIPFVGVYAREKRKSLVLTGD